MSFKELLPTRIPEFLQGDNELTDYLEVAGELFDEFNKAIEDFDHYHDAAKVAETRLRDLAMQFAMQFPRNLNVELQRVILRDLEAIYQKQGTIDVIHWIFRLIGWDVSLENAWVLNPEYYEPKIIDEFELDDYGGEKTIPTMTNFYSRDYRAFLLGKDLTFENGTYFRGRKFFDLKDSFLKNEIVGEYYNQSTKTRTTDKMMATPYLFIRVSEETYNIFISPYEDPDTGEVFDYTEVEFFNVVKNIFDFFLFDAMRPSHVRVVIIVAPQFLKDEAVIEDPLEETWWSDPLELEEEVIVDDTESSILHHKALVGVDFLAGTPPSPYNKDMVINPVAFRNLSGYKKPNDFFYYEDHAGRNYSIVRNEEDYIGPRCGAYDWNFITPHEDGFDFRRVWTPEETEIDPTGATDPGKPYPEDLETLALCFDLTERSFGIIEESGSRPIIVRNPTHITSYNLNPDVKPANAFDLGNKLIDPETNEEYFDPNLIIAFDFRDGGELLADTTDKFFYYLYDLKVFYKHNNAQTHWQPFLVNPKEGDLNNLTEMNTFAPVFIEPVPYDFEFDVAYQAQPHWENRY